MGDDAWLWKLDCEFHRFGYVGDTHWMRGRVTRRYLAGGENRRSTSKSGVKTNGAKQRARATVLLPSREHGPLQLPNHRMVPQPVRRRSTLSYTICRNGGNVTELSMRDAVSERAPRPTERAHQTSSSSCSMISASLSWLLRIGPRNPESRSHAERGILHISTTAICSPARLLGPGHHRVGMGMLPDLPVNFPGYTGTFPDNAATIAEILKADGYVTSAIGKWHLTASAPTHWPLRHVADRRWLRALLRLS